MPDYPIVIHHRRNTLAQLRDTPAELGVEMDIRSFGSELIVAHDPFVSGVPFSEWVKHYHHRIAIFNVKEEGLESAVSAVAQKAGIEDFFFLDQSMPFLVKTALGGERRSAVRVSEFESVETALNFAPFVDWVWVDTFTKFPLDAVSVHALRAAGLKLCLVSPDLLGRDAESDFISIQAHLTESGLAMDAVCTKQPSRWTAWRNPGTSSRPSNFL